MRRNTVVLVATVIGMALSTPIAQATDYEVDPMHSSIIFTVTHMNAGNVYGAFTDFEGDFTYDPENSAENAIQMTVKTASVNTFVEARDEHLRKEDFFNVPEFPAMSFTSTSWEPVEDETGVYEVTGDFTLLETTKPITARATVIGQNEHQDGAPMMGLEFNFVVQRSDFGMDFSLENLSDEIPVVVAIEGVATTEVE